MASKVSGSKFKKKCGVNFKHQDWGISDGQTVKVRRNLPKEPLSALDKVVKDINHVTTVSYCDACVDYAKRYCTECGKSKSVSVDKQVQSEGPELGINAESQTDFPKYSDPRVCSDEERQQIAFALGSAERENVLHDCQEISTIYKDIQTLKQLDADVYITNRNKIILSFLNGISQNSTKLLGSDIKKATAIEHIYQLNSQNLVAPVSFIQNVLQYQAAQSRFCVDLNSKLSPSGSYPTLTKWLASQSATPTKLPSSDCMIAFDNDQVVGKTWRIRLDNKINTMIVTSICAVTLDESFKQYDLSLHPRNWLNYEGFNEKLESVRNRSGQYFDTVYNTHYELLFRSLNDSICSVYEEQSLSFKDGQFSDQIDQNVAQSLVEKETISCALCSSVYQKSKIKCDICKVNLREAQKRKQESSPAIDEKSALKTKKQKRVVEKEYRFDTQLCNDTNSLSEIANKRCRSKIFILDPLPFNPNSYESIKLVLRKIGFDAGVSRYKSEIVTETDHPRQWVFIVCDGLPYGLAHKLIHDTYYCCKCHDSVVGLEVFKNHNKKLHNGEEIQIIFEFDWVILLIGKGHFEMNMIKSYFELNWEPFLKNLSKHMGFRSERALQCAKLCRDNHKAWQLLKIFYHATLRELLVPYIRDSILNDSNPSPQGYIKWCKECKNPNYMYMHEQVLTYCQALLNYRHGLPTNSHNIITSGKEIFAPLFYGRQHPKYRYIALFETCDYFLYPPEVKELVEKNSSFDTSGTGLKGEDLDFKLETVNKKSKAWVSAVPSFDNWLQIFRNLDKLDELKDSFLRSCCFPDEPSQMFYIDDYKVYENEISSWQTVIRKAGYLADPMTTTAHRSLDGDVLDEELINFTTLAVSNREMFFDDTVAARNFTSSCKLKSVFVTKAERNESELLRNQTKEVIYKKLDDLLSLVPDNEIRNYYSSVLSSSKTQTKEVLLSLYTEIQTNLQDDSADLGENDDSI